ncbi:MAG: hypothetical protein ACJAYX_001360 [Planctomycetota bacterium]|jgi:hypothetical protein
MFSTGNSPVGPISIPLITSFLNRLSPPVLDTEQI